MTDINSPRWRFWPVILLAIFYPLNMNMIGLAIPIFFFRRAIPTEIIGLLSAATTITYSISPVIFSKISDRLPRKTSVVIAMGGTLATQLIFYITLHPILFLIARLGEGFIVGLFWTNLQASISANIYHRHRKLTALYNLSWNMGLILGLVMGAILTYFIDDLTIIFYSAPFFLLFNLLIAIFAFQEPLKNSYDSSASANPPQHKDQNYSDRLEATKHSEIDKIQFPMIYPFILIILYSLVRASVKFLFPIKSEVLGFETYTVYGASIFYALAQSIAMIGASTISLRNLKVLHIIILLPILIFTPVFGLNTNYFIFIVLFLIIGACTGMLYGISLRFVLILNMKHKQSLYSAILESVIGIFFLVAPILAGYLSYIDLDLPFYVLTFICVFLSVSIIGLSQKRINLKHDHKRDDS